MPRCEGGRRSQRIEAESKEMNMLRQKVHDAYAQMLDLTLYGEKVLEWNNCANEQNIKLA